MVMMGTDFLCKMQTIADSFLSITADDSKEIIENQGIAQEINLDFSFAHTYTAWERGSDANMNGLVHQYIPKNWVLTFVTNDELELTMTKFNHRARKCLDFMSPFEVFFNHSVALTS